MKHLLTIINQADFLGYPVELSYKSSHNYKSTLGGILTIFITVFAIYSIIYFGQDMIEKKNPITRLSSIYSTEAKIPLKNLGLLFKFTTKLGLNIDHSRYLTFVPMFYMIRTDSKTQDYTVEVVEMFVEPCNPEHFYGPVQKVMNSTDAPIYDAYCLNPVKVRYANGSIGMEENLEIYNDPSSTPSQFMAVNIRKCHNETDGKICAANEEITEIIHDIIMETHFMDSYVDLNNNTSPLNYYLSSYPITLSVGTAKTQWMSIRN
jgi:hypothetical protein